MASRATRGMGPVGRVADLEPRLSLSSEKPCIAEWLVIAVSLSLLLAVAGAPSAAERAQARKLKDQAFTLISEGQYAEGIERLEAAYQAVPHPTFLFNVAVVYDQWTGHCAESLEAFERFFAACQRCKVKPTATARFARVQERCQVRLAVETTPPGARVEIDDVDRGATPVEVVLVPGRHRVEIRKEGFLTAREEVLLEPGRDQSLSRALSIVPPATQPPSVAAPAVVAAAPAPAPDRTWAWVGFGAGAVGVGVGAAFTALAMDSVNEEEVLRNQAGVDPSEVREARDEARDRATLAYVGYGVGIAGLATGAILFLLSEDQAPPPSVQVGTDGQQLVVSGRF